MCFDIVRTKIFLSVVFQFYIRIRHSLLAFNICVAFYPKSISISYLFCIWNIECYYGIYFAVTNNNPADTKQIFRLAYKKLPKQNQLKKEQMPKMSPHVNSEDLTSQPAQGAQNQQVQQQTQLPVQSGNNQSTPSPSAQPPQHTRRPFIDFLPYSSTNAINWMMFTRMNFLVYF